MTASEYKARGGDYTTPKSKQQPSQKNLNKWTEEEWQTKEGSGTAKQADGSRKRYLPRKAWDKLSEEEKQATEDKKLEASKKGKQFVGNTPRAKESRKNISGNKRGRGKNNNNSKNDDHKDKGEEEEGDDDDEEEEEEEEEGEEEEEDDEDDGSDSDGNGGGDDQEDITNKGSEKADDAQDCQPARHDKEKEQGGADTSGEEQPKKKRQKKA